MASMKPTVIFLLAAFIFVSATDAYSNVAVQTPAPAPSKVPITTPPPAPRPPTSPPTTVVKPPTTPPPTPYHPPATPSPPLKPPTTPAPPVKPPTTSPSPSPAPTTPPMPKVKSKADCLPLCNGRCKLHSRQNICVRACVTCCDRCRCVPPGTYGNREMCGKCYTEMKTHNNRPKCP